ncbi:MAG TPA: protein translocase subunit SecF [Acidimicrobiales bacterium]|nr:protein translocase subunit SecF [Acidimicrobiales bacterium]
MTDAHTSGVTRLYRGQTHFDFVGRRRWWFTASMIIIVAGLASLGIRGFNLGIDFKGGSSWEVLAPHATVAQMQSAVIGAGLPQPTVQELGGKTFEVTADLNSLSQTAQFNETTKVVNAMAHVAHVKAYQVSTASVGPTWGGGITRRAIEALIVFFVAVVLYISVRFEPKMALAAFIAMVHDLLVTVGVFSLFGFQITPDTVIALLTILGYSLYDTVVVFDRVRDNASTVLKTGDLSYADMVNLSMNQTLARSINTSLVAILPVLSVLIVGAYILGATTLQNYGLALAVGLFSGAYSSIFIASPLLSWMKEREPRYRDLAQRVGMRADRAVLTPATAALIAADSPAPSVASGSGTATSRSTRAGTPASSRPSPVQPRARKQKRR